MSISTGRRRRSVPDKRRDELQYAYSCFALKYLLIRQRRTVVR